MEARLLSWCWSVVGLIMRWRGEALKQIRSPFSFERAGGRRNQNIRQPSEFVRAIAMSLQARTAVEFCADVASNDGGERADMAGSIDVGDGRVLSWCVFFEPSRAVPPWS